MLVRRVARPMLASLFVAAGYEALKSLPKRPEGTPLTKDPLFQFRANAAAMLGGGALLAVGPVPRLAALVCAGSLAATTYVAHPFWKIKDPAAQKEARTQFLKNLSIFGGLLTAIDTKTTPGRAARAALKTEGAVAAAATAGKAGRKAAKLAKKAA